MPTLLGVILPEERPRFWSRDYSEYQIDEVAGGLVFIEEEYGHAETRSSEEKVKIYDTTQLGTVISPFWRRTIKRRGVVDC